MKTKTILFPPEKLDDGSAEISPAFEMKRMNNRRKGEKDVV